MNQPTKEQWEEIAKEMNSLFGSVHLKCDGYLLSTKMERDKNNRLYIVVYINGYIRGKWIEVVDDPEQFSDIPKRFYRHSSRQRMSAKELKVWEKLIGKRECKKKGYYGRRYLSEPGWLKPGPLIRHLKKYNTNIQVLTADEYQAELALVKEG